MILHLHDRLSILGYTCTLRHCHKLFVEQYFVGGYSSMFVILLFSLFFRAKTHHSSIDTYIDP